MSIFDAKFEIIDDADLYADGTTAYAGTFKELDWVESGLEMGQGTPIYLCIRVGTTVHTTATVQSFLQLVLLPPPTLTLSVTGYSEE